MSGKNMCKFASVQKREEAKICIVGMNMSRCRSGVQMHSKLTHNSTSAAASFPSMERLTVYVVLWCHLVVAGNCSAVLIMD